MKYIQTAIFTALCMLLTSSLAFAANDTSPDGKYSFQLESDGYSLPTYYHNGYTYVEGIRGNRYNIRVFNRSAARVEAVVTVDGRDAITGQPGDYKANRGYVIEPYGSVLIKGFRTSWSNVAGFYFTDIEDSYSARVGTPQNVGVIGVAIFEEKQRRVYRRDPIRGTPSPRKRGLGTGYGEASPSYESEDMAHPSEISPKSSASERRSRRGGASAMPSTVPAPSQNMGTGYGGSEYSPASETEFRRDSRNPEARLSIYYDDRESLISRGVIPRAVHRPVYRPGPNPFPANRDPGFTPPPPAYYWE